MRDLYPPVTTVHTHLIDVGAGHRLYVEECGNRLGQPVVFLHGGPGSGCSPDHRRYFDPAHYRIVLVDQRGSGRSTPLGETRANVTDTLVQDLDRVRRQLGIERWMLFGGSWGATLALRYAQAFPGAVSAMLLRGSFLGRPRDMDWFFGDNGAARIFPDAYSDFVHPVPAAERGDLVAAYHRRVHGADREAALAWAGRWRDWANRVATWTVPSAATEMPPEPLRLLAKVGIETHYAANRYFIADRPLLDAADQVPDVPISIVHGRRDLVCPCDAAWTLQRCIPGSRLLLLPDAGHLMSEPVMVDALVGETDRLKAVGRGSGRLT